MMNEQARAGENTLLVRLEDAAIDASACAKVARVNNEVLHLRFSGNVRTGAGGYDNACAAYYLDDGLQADKAIALLRSHKDKQIPEPIGDFFLSL